MYYYCYAAAAIVLGLLLKYYNKTTLSVANVKLFINKRIELLAQCKLT